MSDPGYIPITLLYAPLKGLSPLVGSVVVTLETSKPYNNSPGLTAPGDCYVTVTLTNGFALKHLIQPGAYVMPERISAGQVKTLTYYVMEFIETLNRIEREK